MIKCPYCAVLSGGYFLQNEQQYQEHLEKTHPDVLISQPEEVEVEVEETNMTIAVEPIIAERNMLIIKISLYRLVIDKLTEDLKELEGQHRGLS